MGNYTVISHNPCPPHPLNFLLGSQSFLIYPIWQILQGNARARWQFNIQTLWLAVKWTKLRRRGISTGKEMIDSGSENINMRQLLLLKRLIFVTLSHVLPLPFSNLITAQKDFTLLSFPLSFSHTLSFQNLLSVTTTLSIYTILCAISGYPRTIHSLYNQQNKASFIRVDLVPPPSLKTLSQE